MEFGCVSLYYDQIIIIWSIVQNVARLTYLPIVERFKIFSVRTMEKKFK